MAEIIELFSAEFSDERFSVVADSIQNEYIYRQEANYSFKDDGSDYYAVIKEEPFADYEDALIKAQRDFCDYAEEMRHHNPSENFTIVMTANVDL